MTGVLRNELHRANGEITKLHHIFGGMQTKLKELDDSKVNSATLNGILDGVTQQVGSIGKTAHMLLSGTVDFIRNEMYDDTTTEEVKADPMLFFAEQVNTYMDATDALAKIVVKSDAFNSHFEVKDGTLVLRKKKRTSKKQSGKAVTPEHVVELLAALFTKVQEQEETIVKLQNPPQAKSKPDTKLFSGIEERVLSSKAK